MYWSLDCTELEYQALEHEVSAYNDWIDLLVTGLAPASAYEDPTDADQYMYATHPSHQDIFGNPGDRCYYEFRENAPHFSLYAPSYEDYEEIQTSLMGRPPESADTLIDILTGPHGHEEIHLGYRLLPMTRKLLND